MEEDVAADCSNIMQMKNPPSLDEKLCAETNLEKLPAPPVPPDPRVIVKYEPIYIQDNEMYGICSRKRKIPESGIMADPLESMEREEEKSPGAPTMTHHKRIEYLKEKYGLVEDSSKHNKGKSRRDKLWRLEEHERLKQGRKLFGDEEHKWKLISMYVGSRTPKQCKTHMEKIPVEREEFKGGIWKKEYLELENQIITKWIPTFKIIVLNQIIPQMNLEEDYIHLENIPIFWEFDEMRYLIRHFEIKMEEFQEFWPGITFQKLEYLRRKAQEGLLTRTKSQGKEIIMELYIQEVIRRNQNIIQEQVDTHLENELLCNPREKIFAHVQNEVE